MPKQGIFTKIHSRLSIKLLDDNIRNLVKFSQNVIMSAVVWINCSGSFSLLVWLCTVLVIPYHCRCYFVYLWCTYTGCIFSNSFRSDLFCCFAVSFHQHDCAVHSNLSFMREFPPVFYFRVDAVFWSVSCQTTLVSSCNVPVSIFCHCRVKLILSQKSYTYCASTRRLIILICGVAQWGVWRSSRVGDVT
jgi:hypothetical protein